MKTVKIYKAGKFLKSFVCKACEICDKYICFYDVPDKNGGKEHEVIQYEELFWFVEYEKHEANVYLNASGVHIVVTW